MTNQENDNPTRVVADLTGLVREGRRFRCILADPPWSFSNRCSRSAAAGKYSCMPLADIKALPVPDLAEPDGCHVHLWAVASMLPEALEVLRAWGFDYKTHLVWAKSGKPGLGNYWRTCHELLLLGVSSRLPFADHSIRSWLEAPSLRHSQKPEPIRALIERVSPSPRLELFARTAAVGWTSFGDQVRDDVLPFVA